MSLDNRETLVIGYGNGCRGDDAIGPAVAQRVDALRWPDVSVKVVHQLTPELAEPLSQAGRALFVDATATPQEPPIAIERLRPAGAHSLTHSCSASALLSLANLVYGQSPPAWIVTIEGEQFDACDSLSELAQTRVHQAVIAIGRWLQNAAGDPKVLDSTF